MAKLIPTNLRGATGRARKRGGSTDPILKVAGVCRGPVLSGDIDQRVYGPVPSRDRRKRPPGA
jgi:hypothetical protein